MKSADDILSVVHSGNIGDIIYSIPALLGALETTGKSKIDFHLRLDTPVSYSGIHPLGNVLLNERYAVKLLPLLKRQPYINKVLLFKNHKVDINLDDFRKLPIRFQTGVIPRWYFWLSPGSDYDLSKRWIYSDNDLSFSDKIIVSRTQRHRNQFISYSFLNKFAKNIVFAGVRQEWDLFKNECPGCAEWIEFEDLLKMANAFNSCKFFIGNQGMPYTLAESMKINRLLEANTDAPNNIPFTPNGKDALSQEGFEAWVKFFVKQTGI